jgi:chemotaxis protein histidine kinase CheA
MIGAPHTEVSPLAERRQARPADEIDPQLVTFFLEEADAQLHRLAADLHAWRAAPAQTEIGQRLARLLHTFKGGARMCGAMGIGALAHGMETRIEQAMAAATDEVFDDLDTSLDRANQMVSELHQQADVPAVLLRARMVPFATVVERLHRVVRQTAKELGRQANLDIRGGDTPVDRSVLERMLGPLEHLLRNAVAHGIEPAAARRAAGKPEIGQITLTIAPGDDETSHSPSPTDGRGLDYAPAIRASAP